VSWHLGTCQPKVAFDSFSFNDFETSIINQAILGMFAPGRRESRQLISAIFSGNAELLKVELDTVAQIKNGKIFLHYWALWEVDWLLRKMTSNPQNLAQQRQILTYLLDFY
jgi:hypothetical protein